MIVLHRYEKDGHIYELMANRMLAEDARLTFEDIRIRVDGQERHKVIRNNAAIGYQYRYGERDESGKLRYKTIPKVIIESYITEV